MLFASAICKEDRDYHLFYVSGRERNRNQLVSFAKHAMTEGFKNFCVVSGFADPKMPAGDLRSCLFTESPDSLKMLRMPPEKNIMLGAVINPYQYTAWSVYTQYFKMMKKVSSG